MLKTIEFIDVCDPCYLTDHHNRDGECLVGVRVVRQGRKPERSAEMFLEEIHGTDYGTPAEITDGDLYDAFLECLDGWRMACAEAPAGRSQDILNAWFVVRWAEQDDDCDMFDPEADQQAYGIELTLDCMAEYREEWGDNF